MDTAGRCIGAVSNDAKFVNFALLLGTQQNGRNRKDRLDRLSISCGLQLLSSGPKISRAIRDMISRGVAWYSHFEGSHLFPKESHLPTQ